MSLNKQGNKLLLSFLWAKKNNLDKLAQKALASHSMSLPSWDVNQCCGNLAKEEGEQKD